jgi:hypothetical protein
VEEPVGLSAARGKQPVGCWFAEVGGEACLRFLATVEATYFVRGTWLDDHPKSQRVLLGRLTRITTAYFLGSSNEISAA